MRRIYSKGTPTFRFVYHFSFPHGISARRASYHCYCNGIYTSEVFAKKLIRSDIQINLHSLRWYYPRRFMFKKIIGVISHEYIHATIRKQQKKLYRGEDKIISKLIPEPTARLRVSKEKPSFLRKILSRLGM